ncbi:LacI family DNA-binding transcriptional regulator [Rhodophyticola sp. CCM32]|uniref:LacI family DNA-binding transcriptional regulator n=1 Tax=Rhodophyticola sp. CCM32 TaxID=2916397 RepID=UPI00107F7CAF|nr:LacI family DNA-binding transcriptional regulator [Rhodophyticola sp. CCM32]QBY01405.1 LacI family DNA-binding transcriptional regulator [Rhodophyticola sp. CCM32]
MARQIPGIKGGETTGRSVVPTLDDVAQHANVSTATVSRCLNYPDRVVEKTRSRVMAAIHELGYSPNFGARALAVRRTNTIGAIIPTMENAVFARGIQAFQEELRSSGVTLLIASSSYREDLEEEQVRTLVARGADGLLLIGYHRRDEIYRFLETQGVPALITWAYDPDAPQISIGFDNRLAMMTLAREVIALGHRQIGVISAEQAGNDRASERVLGIRAAMEEAGLDPGSLTLIETEFGIERGADAFHTMMAGPTRPTVVMCGNDVLAIGALGRAKKMGLRVPDDISITGFDDIELARTADPDLTTVHVPHREMGREAARLLVRMVAGQTQNKSIELKTQRCMRNTLGSPGPVRATGKTARQTP